MQAVSVFHCDSGRRVVCLSRAEWASWQTKRKEFITGAHTRGKKVTFTHTHTENDNNGLHARLHNTTVAVQQCLPTISWRLEGGCGVREKEFRGISEVEECVSPRAECYHQQRNGNDVENDASDHLHTHIRMHA